MAYTRNLFFKRMTVIIRSGSNSPKTRSSLSLPERLPARLIGPGYRCDSCLTRGLLGVYDTPHLGTENALERKTQKKRRRAGSCPRN
jgi:hypothetical protein